MFKLYRFDGPGFKDFVMAATYWSNTNLGRAGNMVSKSLVSYWALREIESIHGSSSPMVRAAYKDVPIVAGR